MTLIPPAWSTGTTSLVDWHHQLGRLVSELACEREDPGTALKRQHCSSTSALLLNVSTAPQRQHFLYVSTAPRRQRCSLMSALLVDVRTALRCQHCSSTLDSVSQSGLYRQLRGVEEMQGGGRRVRIEWGAYITV
ncbi:hypothetical protein FHG87_013120 [Trinorchestia longiramus]|nr:hypothetical protein FHG87_013120 [Trinorchestia longiramus]